MLMLGTDETPLLSGVSLLLSGRLLLLLAKREAWEVARETLHNVKAGRAVTSSVLV